jgi:hypothetical protein
MNKEPLKKIVEVPSETTNQDEVDRLNDQIQDLNKQLKLAEDQYQAIN